MELIQVSQYQTFLFCLESDGMNSGEVQARVSILHGNLRSAERIYIDGGNPEEAMAMYRQLLQWDDAIRIADTYALDERHQLRQFFAFVVSVVKADSSIIFH